MLDGVLGAGGLVWLLGLREKLTLAWPVFSSKVESWLNMAARATEAAPLVTMPPFITALLVSIATPLSVVSATAALDVRSVLNCSCVVGTAAI